MISVLFWLTCGHQVTCNMAVSRLQHPACKVRCQDCDSNQSYTLAQIGHTMSLN